VALIVIHAKNDPKEAWVEVDGHKVEGLSVVVCSEQLESGSFSLSLTGTEDADGFEIVWEDFK
jgi:hypothetical protein